MGTPAFTLPPPTPKIASFEPLWLLGKVEKHEQNALTVFKIQKAEREEQQNLN